MSIPYIPLYVADFEADTAHLSLEEDGAYNRLLRLCWRTPGCSVPDDDAWIMRRLRVDAETFQRAVAPVIAEFFKRSKGRLFSPRLSREFERINALHDKRVAAGKKGGRPAKSLGNNEQSESRALAKQKHLEPELEPKPELDKREANASLARVRAGRKSRIPVDAILSDRQRLMAAEKGMSEAEAEAQFLRFRDWAVAKGQSYVDWDAAWRNWITSPHFKAVTGAANVGRPTRADAKLSAFVAGARR